MTQILNNVHADKHSTNSRMLFKEYPNETKRILMPIIERFGKNFATDFLNALTDSNFSFSETAKLSVYFEGIAKSPINERTLLSVAKSMNALLKLVPVEIEDDFKQKSADVKTSISYLANMAASGNVNQISAFETVVNNVPVLAAELIRQSSNIGGMEKIALGTSIVNSAAFEKLTEKLENTYKKIRYKQGTPQSWIDGAIEQIKLDMIVLSVIGSRSASVKALYVLGRHDIGIRPPDSHTNTGFRSNLNELSSFLNNVARVTKSEEDILTAIDIVARLCEYKKKSSTRVIRIINATVEQVAYPEGGRNVINAFSRNLHNESFYDKFESMSGEENVIQPRFINACAYLLGNTDLTIGQVFQLEPSKLMEEYRKLTENADRKAADSKTYGALSDILRVS